MSPMFGNKRKYNTIQYLLKGLGLIYQQNTTCLEEKREKGLRKVYMGRIIKGGARRERGSDCEETREGKKMTARSEHDLRTLS